MFVQPSPFTGSVAYDHDSRPLGNPSEEEAAQRSIQNRSGGRVLTDLNVQLFPLADKGSSDWFVFCLTVIGICGKNLQMVQSYKPASCCQPTYVQEIIDEDKIPVTVLFLLSKTSIEEEKPPTPRMIQFQYEILHKQLQNEELERVHRVINRTLQLDLQRFCQIKDLNQWMLPTSEGAFASL